MKKTLQKKLNDLGDRLKKKHPAYGELFEIVEYKHITEKERQEIDKYLMEKHSKNPYDIAQKGLKYDTLKKEHEALKKLCDESLAQRLIAETARDKCIEALKSIVITEGDKAEFHNINAKSLFKIAGLINQTLNNK